MGATVYPWGDDPAGQYDWFIGKAVSAGYKGGSQMETENVTELTGDNTDDTMQVNPANPSAGAETPEDTQGTDFGKVIDAQNKTIETLLGQIESLNGQISKLVRSSGTASSVDPDGDVKPDPAPTMGDDYVYLKELGSQIGKRDM